jgi:hypothetical protein
MALSFEQHSVGLPRQCCGNNLEGAWALKELTTDDARAGLRDR